jgi:hypothetical protein
MIILFELAQEQLSFTVSEEFWQRRSFFYGIHRPRESSTSPYAVVKVPH